MKSKTKTKDFKKQAVTFVNNFTTQKQIRENSALSKVARVRCNIFESRVLFEVRSSNFKETQT